MAGGSYLPTYQTQADLPSGLADGSFAQVLNNVSDPTKNGNWQYLTVGGWGQVNISLFGVEVANLFNLMTPKTPAAMLLSAAIKAGEVHLIAHGYCVADGSTDDSDLINDLNP